MPTHYSGTPQETLALNTLIKLTRSVDSLASRLSQRGTLGELTESQFGVLETLGMPALAFLLTYCSIIGKKVRLETSTISVTELSN